MIGHIRLAKVTTLNFPPKKYPRPILSKNYGTLYFVLNMFINTRHTCAFQQNPQKLFMNNFCVSELQTLKFLTQKEAMVMEISATSPSPNVHAGKNVFFLKKITVFTFQQFVPTYHVKLRSLNLKLQVPVFQGQDFAFMADINICYRKITAKKVTPISFLS